MDIARTQVPTAPPEFTLPEETFRRRLVTGANREALEAYLGTHHYETLRTLAVQAHSLPPPTGPRLYLLPGIMGSRLGTQDGVLWIDPDKISAGRLPTLALSSDSPAAVSALGPMVPMYLKLKLKLELAGFDVRFHAYDWRQGLETLGRELLERLHQDPAPRVLLLGHSMGGLVSRVALMLEQRTVAGSKVGRLVLIGTPNAGSFASVMALRGVYPAVRKIATLDPNHSPETLAARVFNTFPGLLHLLPSRDIFDAFDLCDPNNWPDSPHRPPLQDIARVRDLLAPPDERFVCIAGINQETVTGLERRGNAFDYLTTCRGDGTVPAASAILPNVPVYYADELHPALPNNDAVTDAAIELLTRTDTSHLPRTWQPKHAQTHRIEEAVLRQQDTRKRMWQTLSMEERRALLLGLALPI